MSHEINCRECNFANPSGSRFCSNCGAKLPPSTHIICPNCQSPNSHDRIFCDNCGTRLVKEQTIPLEEGDQEKPPGRSAKAFTLPARRPGETGELDPNLLPDWLRTGETASVEPTEEKPQGDLPEWLRKSLENAQSKEKLPRLEDLTPEKQVTDDLPDWLIDEGDADPIIANPEAISTELYLDLVSKDEEQIGGDSPIDASGAVLPDWLSEANKFPETGQLESDKIDDSPKVEEPPVEDEPFEVPSWLSAMTESDSDFDSVIGSEYSTNLTGLTDLLSTPEQPEEENEEVEDNAGDFTDWLSESFAPDDESTPPIPESSQQDADLSLTNWLSAPFDEENDVLPTSQEEKDGLADWLFDSGDAPQTDDTPKDESELDDWLSELNQLNGEEGGSDSALLEDISDAPDWLVQGIEESESEEPVVDDTSANIASEIVHSLMGDAEHVPTDFAELFQVDTDDSEGLPDWLANAAASGNNFVAEDDEPPEILDELFEKEEFAAQSELDWLMQTGGLELPESSTGQMGIPDELKGPSPKAEELDWLSDLASLDTNTLQAADAEAGAADDDFDEVVHSEPAGDLEEISTEAGRTPTDEPFIADSEEWIDTASYLASESQLQKEMPDWLSGIEEPVSDEREPVPGEDAILDDELPNWLDNLEAKDEVLDVSSAFSELTDDSEGKPASPGGLVGAPKEFAGEGLPNWLQDSTHQTGEADVFLPEEGDEEKALPDWLQRDEVAQQDELGAEGVFPGDVTSELDALLDDLPPASQEQLVAAELPDWLQVIRPGGEKPDDSSYVGESVSEVEQKQGPLAGLRGVIGIESAATVAYENPSLPPLTVTTEQQQQVVLLRQLSQEGHIAAGVQPGASYVAAPAWLRILLALLLLVAVVAGLLLPGSFMQAPDSLPGTEAAYHAIEAAAGQTVLVAFDYAPSMAGELSPQAERILQRLAENESVVLGISQYTAGTILADAALVQISGSNLGYLPGEAVGLRLLSVCLQKNGGSCDVIPGWSNDAAMQEAISDVQLVVVLTGNRDNFVYWVEQVAQPTGIPMVAGITQSLGPVTDPYLASGQLAGVIEGAPGTAVYEQLAGVTRDTAQLQQQLNAQTFAQLLIVILLLIGMIVYGVIAPVINRSRKAATTR